MGRGRGGRRYQEPAPLQDILPRVMRGLKPKAGNALSRVRELWPSVVGEKTARRCRPVSLEQGCLTVEVASAALRQHLSVFRREEILEGLAETGVKRLRCKVSGRR